MDIRVIDDSGEPSEEFQDMIEGTTRGWLKNYKRSDPKTRGYLYVMAIQRKSGSSAYWGVIDMRTIPEEDVMIEVLRRFYAAYRVEDPKQITGFGILDIRFIMDQIEPPRMGNDGQIIFPKG